MSIWMALALLAVVIAGAIVVWQRRAKEPPAAPVLEPLREAGPPQVADTACDVELPHLVEVPPALETPPVVEPALVIEASPAIEPPPVAEPVRVAPPPAPVAEPPRAQAPPVAPPVEPPEITAIQSPRTTAKPPPPLELVSRVLLLERATPAQWDAAIAIESVDAGSPFADSLTGSLQRQMPSTGASLYRARFEQGDALALAQANLMDLKERIERRDAARTGQPDPARDPSFAAWLDGAASAALAGQCLAAWVRARHLGALDAESAELKSAIAAAQARLDAEALRLLKGSSQDVSRFLREAREGYAAALRKPVFLERVEAACKEAGAMWSRLEARLDAIRTQLAVQADAPRLGEVQLERALAALRALHDERRVQALGARLLAAIHGLRLALGPSHAKAESPLVPARERWRAAASAERTLLDRLIERVRTAKAPEYAGKGEFESNRTAARAAYDRLVAEGGDAAGVALEAACAAQARGFLDGEADRFMLYVRVEPDGRIAEWRRAPIGRDGLSTDAREATAGAAR